MKKPNIGTVRLWVAALALCLTQPFLMAPAVALEDDAPIKLQSLRVEEVTALGAEGEGTRFGRDQPPLPRDFVQQPPLIPHKIDGYTITKNFNKCLDCHAWTRAKESGATKISVSHFRDRQGVELSGVSPLRYFCSQCHVPQSDATPLVGNTFQPGAGMR